MKKIYTTLVLFMVAAVTFAQGIAVQGIARDGTDAALTNLRLTFEFIISKADGSTVFKEPQSVNSFKESQSITTDSYGLFSHVVSAGTATVGNFNDIDFSIQGLKLSVWIQYDGSNIQVYSQDLQHVPYAHYAQRAANGVPPGTVVAFMGVDGKIPEGWVKCDGADITNKGASYNALKAVIGNSLPDLRGHFLKGEGKATGIPEAGIVPGVVGEYQGQDILSHDHAVDITPEKKEGAHAHFITRLPSDGQWGANISMQTTVESNGSDEKWANAPGHQDKKSTSYDGEHTHRINGNTKGNGGAETRPWTAIVNYIIKL